MKDLTIVLSGQAGQGLMTIEKLLAHVVKDKYFLFSSPEFMSRVRGGNNSIELVIASEPVMAWRHKIDILVILGNNGLSRMKTRLKKNTLIISESQLLSTKDKEGLSVVEFDISGMAKEAGSPLYKNTVVFGLIAKLLNLDNDSCHESIKSKFFKLKTDIISKNINAFNLGHKAGGDIKLPFTLPKISQKPRQLLMDGTTAVGLGALAGGVNYLASYPMSPSTGLMLYLAQKGEDFDVLVEQAEDEIAALNMVIGAWYAGARSMATTSGGGFALMGEALSLSAITETPCVIHLAMRPGPATGLPTRTEQGDLNLALYSGHGEFPRIILTPGNILDLAYLTQKSFYLADKYQVPVIILTDQFILDSMMESDTFTFSNEYLQTFITKTAADYKRYSLSSGPISPRGIPGYGKGLIKADSDEHTESGLITEDFSVRNAMNEKRLSKLPLILEDYQQPELIGSLSYDRLFVGFGSTYGVLKEVIGKSSENDAFLYFKQVYPLPESVKKYFKRAKEVITVENNATGQFAALLNAELSVSIDRQIKKYSGEPFSIEEIEKEVKGGSAE